MDVQTKSKVSVRALCVIFLFLFTSVSIAEESDEETNWKHIQMPFNYQNIQVPRELLKKMREVLMESGASKKTLESIAEVPVTVQTELRAADKNVLLNGLNYRHTFIEGGGSLDLFDFLRGKGEFSLRITPDFKPGEKFHLLYISDSPEIEVEGSTWGNGCGKIYDLSDKANLFVADEGVNLTSARKLYMSFLAGTFVFFQLIEEHLHMGYIRVRDSRYPQFSCDKI